MLSDRFFMSRGTIGQYGAVLKKWWGTIGQYGAVLKKWWGTIGQYGAVQR